MPQSIVPKTKERVAGAGFEMQVSSESVYKQHMEKIKLCSLFTLHATDLEAGSVLVRRGFLT